MLDDMTRTAIQVLNKNKQGFVLMVEGASIDKQAHRMDTERWIWDAIEFDKAIGAALEFARKDGNTLVIVTADHETAGVTLNGVGNPALRDQLGINPDAARDYPMIYRDYPNYVDADGDGYPDDPNPTKKLTVGYGAGVDHYEDYLANPTPAGDPATIDPADRVAKANTARDSNGYRVVGQVESGVSKLPRDFSPPTRAVHTATDVPLSAFGPGAHLFTGVQDNTEVFFKIMYVLGGKY
jgi:alkaline phosphatase